MRRLRPASALRAGRLNASASGAPGKFENMQAVRKALIIFMRYPEAGKVKSRLAARIGREEASRVYEYLVRRTLGVAADFKRLSPETDLFISITPRQKLAAASRSHPGPWVFFPQEGVGLGERMENAVGEVFSMGYDHAALVGTDIANLQPEDFSEAFEALAQGQAALGPAADGGFYLIGLNRPCPPVFQPDEWGSKDVFSRTERLLKDAGFSVRSVQRRQDVDHSEDLESLKGRPDFEAGLSIVIPTLNLGKRVESLVQGLNEQLWPNDEVIIAHGRGSGCGIAQDLSERVRHVITPVGRGLQMNKGAEIARGGLFLFLHADSIPPPNFPYSVRKIATTLDAGLGCFQLAFSPSDASLDLIAAWANFRTRTLKLPYGDQGLFCRREIFEKAGGFKRSFLMEDVDFVKSCRQFGRLLALPDKMLTSPARYVEMGVLRASFKNHMVMALYHLGVDEKRLYSLYYDLGARKRG